MAPCLSGSVPRRPTPNTTCRKSVSSPVTGDRSSPSPESTRALRSGPAAVPTSAWDTMRRSSTSSGSVFSAVIQAMLTTVFRAGLSAFAMG